MARIYMEPEPAARPVRTLGDLTPEELREKEREANPSWTLDDVRNLVAAGVGEFVELGQIPKAFIDLFTPEEGEPSPYGREARHGLAPVTPYESTPVDRAMRTGADKLGGVAGSITKNLREVVAGSEEGYDDATTALMIAELTTGGVAGLDNLATKGAKKLRRLRRGTRQYKGPDLPDVGPDYYHKPSRRADLDPADAPYKAEDVIGAREVPSSSPGQPRAGSKYTSEEMEYITRMAEEHGLTLEEAIYTYDRHGEISQYDFLRDDTPGEEIGRQMHAEADDLASRHPGDRYGGPDEPPAGGEIGGPDDYTNPDPFPGGERGLSSGPDFSSYKDDELMEIYEALDDSDQATLDAIHEELTKRGYLPDEWGMEWAEDYDWHGTPSEKPGGRVAPDDDILGDLTYDMSQDWDLSGFDDDTLMDMLEATDDKQLKYKIMEKLDRRGFFTGRGNIKDFPLTPSDAADAAGYKRGTGHHRLQNYTNTPDADEWVQAEGRAGRREVSERRRFEEAHLDPGETEQLSRYREDLLLRADEHVKQVWGEGNNAYGPLSDEDVDYLITEYGEEVLTMNSDDIASAVYGAQHPDDLGDLSPLGPLGPDEDALAYADREMLDTLERVAKAQGDEDFLRRIQEMKVQRAGTPGFEPPGAQNDEAVWRAVEQRSQRIEALTEQWSVDMGGDEEARELLESLTDDELGLAWREREGAPVNVKQETVDRAQEFLNDRPMPSQEEMRDHFVEHLVNSGTMSPQEARYSVGQAPDDEIEALYRKSVVGQDVPKTAAEMQAERQARMEMDPVEDVFRSEGPSGGDMFGRDVMGPEPQGKVENDIVDALNEQAELDLDPANRAARMDFGEGFAKLLDSMPQDVQDAFFRGEITEDDVLDIYHFTEPPDDDILF